MKIREKDIKKNLYEKREYKETFLDIPVYSAHY